MLDEISVVQIIKRKFGSERGEVRMALQNGRSFKASITDDGIMVDDLGSQPLLPWAVFVEAVNILRRNGGRAERGDATGSKLGDPGLSLNTIEGHIAYVVYNKKVGDNIFRRISPIAAILVWAGVCDTASGELILRGR